MIRRKLFFSSLVMMVGGVGLLTSPLLAQSNKPPATPSKKGQAGISLGEPATVRWRIGYIVTGQGGAVRGINAYATVPMDWPEQKVRIVEKDVSRAVKSVRFKTINKGVRQMVISIPRLGPRETVKAIYTFEIEKRAIEGPKNGLGDTAGLKPPKKPSFEMRKNFLLPSPFIESRDPKIVALANRITPEQASGWKQAETIFDWVRSNVRYKFDKQIRGAAAALEAGVGDCEELSSLFVALCRVKGIPARAVWIPGHCYPEFYLEDETGQGHWYPCQAAGSRQFGSMHERRPILQKGDNFQVPGQRKRHQYLHETFTARDAKAAPEVRFIRELVKK